MSAQAKPVQVCYGLSQSTHYDSQKELAEAYGLKNSSKKAIQSYFNKSCDFVVFDDEDFNEKYNAKMKRAREANGED